MKVNVLGIIGGGQLGRMLTIPAKVMGFEVYCVDPTPDCPAAQVGAKQIQGGLSDRAALEKLFEVSDVVTWEIEHIDVEVLKEVAASSAAVLRPSLNDLALIQDKLKQKNALQDAGISVADFSAVAGYDDLLALFESNGPLVVKSRRGGFDGRGNFVVDSKDQIKDCLDSLDGDLYAEVKVAFDSEVSVIAAKGESETEVFLPVDTVHENNICMSVTMPSRLQESLSSKAINTAQQVLAMLEGPGVYAIEMFVVGDQILVNEIAPRVHNSGHLTIEACNTSQFEQHIRAVMNLPLGDSAMVAKSAAMVNILGRGDSVFEPSSLQNLSDVKIHWYGKSPVKVDRKMGHITAVGDDTPEVILSRCLQMREKLDV